MNTARLAATATLLPNGKVLIAGGIGENGHVLNSTELYDPTTDTLTASNPIRYPRHDATAVVLPDSQVLIAGGAYTVTAVAPYTPLSSTELNTQ